MRTAKVSLLMLGSVTLLNCGEGEVVSPNANVAHLGVHGTFVVDATVPDTVNDARNPGRVTFQEMRTFSFFKNADGTMPLATGCTYAYRGAKGDPFYYPNTSKTSIWDLFELDGGPAGCSAFKNVALRAPHGNPIHMHMRYGGADTSFDALLAMSQEPTDKPRYNPWWSVYCAEGVSGCDK